MLYQDDVVIYLQCWDYPRFSDNLTNRYGPTVAYQILERLSTVEHWAGWYRLTVGQAIEINRLVGGDTLDSRYLLTVERRFQGIIDRLGAWVNSPTMWGDHEQGIRSAR